jgi:RNA binding exosome subunit
MKMKLAHTISISVFVRADDDEEKLKEALLSLVPLDLEKEKLTLSRTVAQGFENRIVILELALEKERHTNKVIDALIRRLSSDQKKLILIQENRLDEDCCFYLRFNKKALLDNKLELTDSGDCFHVKMTIAAFPKRKESARKVVEEMLSRT